MIIYMIKKKLFSACLASGTNKHTHTHTHTHKHKHTHTHSHTHTHMDAGKTFLSKDKL